MSDTVAKSDANRSAVALGYTPGMPAPKLLALGRGAVAQAILERAIEIGIPVRTNPELVGFLMQLDLNEWVPPELFAAVAEVISWAYMLDQKQGKQLTPEDW